MTRRRRALVLLGLALALGALAAMDVSRRERALREQVGPLTDVVVARKALEAGHVVRLDDLGVRRLPARYAPAGAAMFPGALAGRKLAVAVPPGGAVTAELMARAPVGAQVARGERAIEVTANGGVAAVAANGGAAAVAANGGVAAGARVDVVVTTGGRAGEAKLALEDVEVLGARPAKDGRVAATLRVTAAQAVYLAAAQSFAQDIRLLARAPGDRRKVGAIAVPGGL